MFNPNEHLMQLKSKEGPKDYLPVQWRLVWFRELCPQGTIDTEELEVDLDREVEAEAFVWNSQKQRSEKVVKQAKGYARYKAIVTDGKGGRSTGTKSENAASFPDYIEKAETGAIGRALAGLGYGTQFAPELNEEHRIVDAPIISSPRPAAVASNGNGQTSNAATEDDSDALLTDQQLNSIRKLCGHLGKAEPERVTSITYLNAKKLIQQLTAEYREHQQANRAS